jgi:hypothetical protein
MIFSKDVGDENCAVPCGIRFLKAQMPKARLWAAQRAF